MAAPVGRPQQALGLLFRRATPDAFQLPALFPSSQFLETTDPQLSCHEATAGLETKQPAKPGRQVDGWLLVCDVLGQFYTFDLIFASACIACRRGTCLWRPVDVYHMYHSFISKPWPRSDCCTRHASFSQLKTSLEK